MASIRRATTWYGSSASGMKCKTAISRTPTERGQVQGAGGGGQDRARNGRANRATSGIDGMT
jgi:hypothetical protein